MNIKDEHHKKKNFFLNKIHKKDAWFFILFYFIKDGCYQNSIISRQ